MIRLVQRKLIIPRGDTGSFTIPAIAAASTADVAIFTILDCRTHTKLFEKSAPPTGETFVFEFTHNDTVNLKPGKYAWDVKFYKNPMYADGQLVNGDEIDSYYAGFSLPECEIRETGDSLLISPDAPSGTLTPEQLDIISAALVEVQEAVEKTETNVEHYPHIEDDNHWYVWDADANEFVDTGVNAIGPGVAAGGTAGQLLKKASSADYDTEWVDDIYATKADTVLETTLSRGRKANTTVGTGSIAWGVTPTASGTYSTAVGGATTADGTYSTAIGQGTQASAANAVAEGAYTVANGSNSHAEGMNTIANHRAQHALGEWNEADSSEANYDARGNYVVIVGNGGADNARSNAYALDWQGNAYYAGDVYVGANSDSTGGTKLAKISDVTVTDVQINNTSIVNNKVANIPIASDSVFGTVKVRAANGISLGSTNELEINRPSSAQIQAGTSNYRPIVPSLQHESTFYGLAKAAGDSTQSASANAVGTYTSEAKAAIQTMLDVPSTGALATKQDTLTFDSTPTTASTNPVTSAGIKDYVDTAITNINTMRIHVCVNGEYDAQTGVPTIQNPDTQTFYLVPGGDSGNLYIEWVYVDNAWERFGSADIDLSGYALKAEVPVESGTGVGSVKTKSFEYNDVIIEQSATGIGSMSEGVNTVASGMGSHAEGYTTTASGSNSHAEGNTTTASGTNSHTEGQNTSASGSNSHAEGRNTQATTMYAHAEGAYTIAGGISSHAEGSNTETQAQSSHTEGFGTITTGSYSHALGKYNVQDSYANWSEWVANINYVAGDKVKVTTTNNDVTTITGYTCKTDNSDESFTASKWTNTNGAMNYVEIVGNGTSNSSRSNAYALDWDGNGKYAGDVYVHANSDSSGGTKLATIADIPSVPVQDVQVNGTSIVSSGIANVPIASSSTLGVIKVGSTSGTGLYLNTTTGGLFISRADLTDIKTGTNEMRPITSGHQHESVFYGLAKAAGDSTQSASANAVGTYTNDAKASIRAMIGATSPDIIAVQDTQPTSTDNKIWIDTDATGSVQVPTVSEMNTALSSKVDDVQVNGSSVVSGGVANIPVASKTDYGTIKVKNADVNEAITNGGSVLVNGVLLTVGASNDYTLQIGGDQAALISTAYQHKSTFYGLAKAAGADMKDIASTTVGTYPDEQKAAIQSMLGVSDLLAPRETSYIASQAYAVGDIFTLNGKLYKVTTAITEGGAVVVQDDGETVSGANAVQCKLGEERVKDVQVNGVSVLNNGVANVPLASANGGYGLVKVGGPSNGVYIHNGSQQLSLAPADGDDIMRGNNSVKPITPAFQQRSTFYGLAKAAGDTTQSQSNNAVGTYTDNAKAAIQHMLGTDTNLAPYESDTTSDAAYAIGELFMLNGKLHQATAAIAIGDTLEVGTNCSVVNASEVFPHDVKVDGTSVVTSGVANVPIMGIGTAGVAKLGGSNSNYGIAVYNGEIYISEANDTQIKTGNSGHKPITATKQHQSTFYGLAKAAGDTTMSSSSNAIGTYTSSAKNAIHTMLGTADLIEVGFVENVTGTTPSITGQANYRYICGEVSTISITPPSAGSIDIIFESGSTASVLTVPNTVKWPTWFDPDDLDANTTYELLITDATYGSVMTWAT